MSWSIKDEDLFHFKEFRQVLVKTKQHGSSSLTLTFNRDILQQLHKFVKIYGLSLHKFPGIHGVTIHKLIKNHSSFIIPHFENCQVKAKGAFSSISTYFLFFLNLSLVKMRIRFSISCPSNLIVLILLPCLTSLQMLLLKEVSSDIPAPLSYPPAKKIIQSDPFPFHCK